ncbi:hypothetical protein CHCC20491_1879 [Bacillus paralicheniformis]|uniref:hypothetical protein n=1 Tax=Bacillus subtilis group TaxID=653685 RepID=UPI0011AA004F|nr:MULTISPECIES: hypothetical protein [Bacillus subtilis group]MCY9237057.1 hypothetical protein [Bacillus licheniformis]TWN93228.1 hypothetical protein CHCC20491_1879 [Bacillus paralicheniformis]
MNSSIFRNEKDILLNQMWDIVLRETQVEDDAGCDWFTLGDDTYIGDTDWLVSSDKEVAKLVNAINALGGYPGFINQKA